MLDNPTVSRRSRVVLDALRPVSFDAGTLTLHAEPHMLAAAQGMTAEIAALAQTCNPTHTGDIRVAFTKADAPASLANPTTPTDMAEHALVKQAIQLLNAKLIGVYPRTK